MKSNQKRQKWIKTLFFVPFGIFVPTYIPKIRSTKQILLCTFSSSLIVEFIQVFSMLGIFDVDDIWLNVLGSYIGFFIWHHIIKWFVLSGISNHSN